MAADRHTQSRRRGWIFGLVGASLAITVSVMALWPPNQPSSPAPNPARTGPVLPQVPSSELVDRQQKTQTNRRNLRTEFEETERALQLAATDPDAALLLLDQIDARYGASALSSVREDLRGQIAARNLSGQTAAPATPAPVE